MRLYEFKPTPVAYVDFAGKRVALIEDNLSIERAKAFMEKFFKDNFCLSGPHTCLVRMYDGKLGPQKSIRFSGDPETLFNKFIAGMSR